MFNIFKKKSKSIQIDDHVSFMYKEQKCSSTVYEIYNNGDIMTSNKIYEPPMMRNYNYGYYIPKKDILEFGRD